MRARCASACAPPTPALHPRPHCLPGHLSPHPQALERIAGLLEEVGQGGASTSSGLVLAERGDSEGVARHPAFRLFGAMNPATDAGGRL